MSFSTFVFARDITIFYFSAHMNVLREYYFFAAGAPAFGRFAPY